MEEIIAALWPLRTIQRALSLCGWIAEEERMTLDGSHGSATAIAVVAGVEAVINWLMTSSIPENESS